MKPSRSSHAFAVIRAAMMFCTGAAKAWHLKPGYLLGNGPSQPMATAPCYCRTHTTLQPNGLFGICRDPKTESDEPLPARTHYRLSGIQPKSSSPNHSRNG